MKKTLFLCGIIAMLSSCKKEEPTDDYCNWAIKDQPIITEALYRAQLDSAGFPEGNVRVTNAQMNVFFDITHKQFCLGGTPRDNNNEAYNFTTSQYYVDNRGIWGMVCGGTALYAYRVIDARLETYIATIALQNMDMNYPGLGHTVDLVAVWQDDSLVYTMKDPMLLNRGFVLASDPSKAADVRDMMRFANEGTLAQKVLMVENTVPGYYAQRDSCTWDGNTYYVRNEVEGVYRSGDPDFSYLVLSKRSMAMYAQSFESEGVTFQELYGSMCKSYGYGERNFHEHPEDVIYVYACAFGFIIYNDGFPTEKFSMFGAYRMTHGQQTSTKTTFPAPKSIWH